MKGLSKDIISVICRFLKKKCVDNLSLCCKLLHNNTLEYKLNKYYLRLTHDIDNTTIQFKRIVCSDSLVDLSTIPSFVTHFYTHYKMDLSLLHNHITHLNLLSRHNKFNDFDQFTKLKTLYISNWKGIYLKLPKSLKKLNISSESFLDTFPEGLTHLTIRSNLFDYKKFPSTLISLKLTSYSFNMKITTFPPNLKILEFGASFNHPIKMLPKTIKKVSFGYNFDQPLDFLHNTSVEKIRLGENFQQSWENLPRSIKKIQIQSETSVDLCTMYPSVKIYRYGKRIHYTKAVEPQWKKLKL